MSEKMTAEELRQKIADEYVSGWLDGTVLGELAAFKRAAFEKGAKAQRKADVEICDTLRTVGRKAYQIGAAECLHSITAAPLVKFEEEREEDGNAEGQGS